MKKILRRAKRVLDRMLGTRSDEIYWRFRHAFGWEDGGMSIDHPHRALLCEAVLRHTLFSRVLEIGCGSGPNLKILAEKFPEALFCGIDISESAVARGRKLFLEWGISNVQLWRAGADDLSACEDASFDVVISDATLLYVGPDKLETAIREMLRVCRGAIVLCEQHTNEDSFYEDRWVHNYRKVFSLYAPGASLQFSKIPEGVWGGEWARYGYIIEVLPGTVL